MTLSPAKLNLIWTAAVNSRVMTGESQTQSWCIASVHPLHYFVAKTQLFNCIRQIITHDWWIWIVLFIPHCYKTSFSSGGCFCAFEILVQSNLVPVVYTGSLAETLDLNGRHCLRLYCNSKLLVSWNLLLHIFILSCKLKHKAKIWLWDYA